jgi:hypothetical protein
MIPDDLLLSIDLADAGGMASVGIKDVAVGKDLEDHAEAGDLVLPDEFPIVGDLEDAVAARPVILGDHEGTLSAGDVACRKEGGASEDPGADA